MAFRVPDGAGFNGNVVYGMLFRSIGTVHASGVDGFGAVALSNSSNNLIANNHFMNLENRPEHIPGCMHGVYIMNGSSNNEIARNQFRNISGDPVRTRNSSNHNDFHENRFILAGQYAAYSDWFCGASCQEEAPGHPRECGSRGNVVRYNTLDRDYLGERLATWHTYPGGNQNAGGSGCSLGGEPRVSTWENTHL